VAGYRSTQGQEREKSPLWRHQSESLLLSLTASRVEDTVRSIPRLDKICKLSASGALADEKHLIFECTEMQCYHDSWRHSSQGIEILQRFM